MTTLNSNIGENIRRFREQFGLSQDYLAKYLNITHAAISHYETGKRSIPTEIISKIATLFGIDEYDLFEQNTDNNRAVIAVAFRAKNLTEDDLKQISNFQTIVRNYLNMKTANKDDTADS